MLEVHVQEGQIESRIPVAKTVVELDAVDDLDPVHEVDVIRAQIAMTVTNAPLCDSFEQQGLMVPEKGAADLTNELPVPARHQVVHEWIDLLEVLLHVEGNPVRLTEFIDGWAAIARRIESSQFHPQIAQL